MIIFLETLGLMSAMMTSNGNGEGPNKLDLSGLENFTFQTSWSPIQSSPKSSTDRQGKSTFRGPRREGGFADKKPRFGDKATGDRKTFEHPKRFVRPEVTIDFFAEEAPFQALIQSLRSSGRTYPLFEIGTLVLEKPERFLVGLAGKKIEENKPAKALFICLLDNMPFETEEEALQYVFQMHFDHFFDKATVEIEKPKGVFSFIYKCPKSGTLITPPNYHKAQVLLQEHYRLMGEQGSFESFQKTLEKASAPEEIEAWLQKMTQHTIYKVKNSVDGEKSFDNPEEAKRYLIEHEKSKCIKAVRNARFSGKLLATMPASSIKSFVEFVLGKERHFPFSTVNHLRGRFRRLGFSLFKRNGIAYVSAVKRRLRLPGMEFSAGIQALVTFLEGQPAMVIRELPKAYLGIEVPAGDAQLPVEEDQKLKSLMQDLNWLVKEGYLTEFSDGRLQLSAMATPIEEAKLENEEALDSEGTSVNSEDLSNLEEK